MDDDWGYPLFQETSIYKTLVSEKKVTWLSSHLAFVGPSFRQRQTVMPLLGAVRGDLRTAKTAVKLGQWNMGYTYLNHPVQYHGI